MHCDMWYAFRIQEDITSGNLDNFQFYHCSDKTDMESTHSSNISAPHNKNMMHAIIPPDALYGTSEKIHSHQQGSSGTLRGHHMHSGIQQPAKFAYVDSADFNDSKVRMNIIHHHHHSGLEQQFTNNLMNNGVQHNHSSHTLVLGNRKTNMAVGPPYYHHTFSRRQHQLQQHY